MLKLNCFCQVTAAGDFQSAERLHGLRGGGARRSMAWRRPSTDHSTTTFDAHPWPPQAPSQKWISSAGAGAEKSTTPPIHDQRPARQQRNLAAGQVTDIQFQN